MPYESDAQRGYMHANHPEIAARWDREERRRKGQRVRKDQPRYGAVGGGHGRRQVDEPDDVAKRLQRKHVLAPVVIPVGMSMKAAQKAGRGAQEARARGRRAVRELRRPESEVGKARFFDPEHRRQRHLGMAELGLGAAGAAGLTLGGRGILRSTRAARQGIAGVVGRKGKEKELAATEALLRRKGVLAAPRDIGAGAGGLAGLGAAAAVHQHATSRKGRAWD